MEKIDLVPTLSTCKKLKELGFPQDTIFTRYYAPMSDELKGRPDFKWLTEQVIENETIQTTGEQPYSTSNKEHREWFKELQCAAPTVPEIAQHLPNYIDDYFLHINRFGKKPPIWSISFQDADSIYLDINNENMSESCALCLIWLIENNHVKF